jgi:uncharacterized protein
VTPPVDDVTRPWWDATRERRLVLQWCPDCEQPQHYPRAMCLRCGRTDLTFRPASGRALVDSFTVVHRSPEPGVEPGYVLARVRLEEGPVLLTHLERCPEPRCDLPVMLDWRALDDGRHLPIFVPQSVELR